ncbi:phage tail tape measure protein [Poseidonocella sedimentorum]|uniref:Phage tail tape measure protein, lambda family n=1 Tax=Poseidonocella sedimentorum TaxID=871652 RepID=A0A1I6DH79_9RHOB|nr:phage tail tape measure protein [Poseidonocella sedimentorum]SFR04738.1 phage tail tape measure protein, lambda family [Poseidonocella sedimentorum]
MKREIVEETSEATDALNDNLTRTADVLAGFNKQIRMTRAEAEDASKRTQELQKTLGGDLKSAFRSIVVDGQEASVALKAVAQSLIQTTFERSVSNVTNTLAGSLGDGIGGVIGKLLPFANGGSFSQGRVTPFATGGVVSQPTYFPMRGGTGLMGEAGPEAIMPLTRGSDGKLGVRAAGGGGGAVNVVMNISTPDARSFERSRSQIAAQMNRALAKGQRNR